MTSRLLISLALATFACPALAAPPQSSPIGTAAEPTEEGLPEIVATATRQEEKPIDVPNTVYVIPREDLDERMPRTLPEALRQTPGVSVQKTSNGQGSPFIRGFTGFRTLALIDGVRLNNSTFREGPNQYWSTIDLNSLERIDLVPGQGSVLYGSDAIGGTLNSLTKDSGFQGREGGTFLDGALGYRFSTAEDSHSGIGEINFGESGKWGLHIDGTLQQYGEVDAAGLGRQPKTGYDQWAYHVRFDAALSDQWSLTAVHQRFLQDDVWRTHSTVFGIPWHGTVIGSDLRRSFDQERTLSYLKLSGEDLGTFVDSASLTISHQSSDEAQHRIRSSRAADISTVEVDTFGLDLQLGKDSAIGTLTYGLDYYRDSVSSSSTSYKPDGSFEKRGIQGPVGDDSTYDILGAYLQNEITLDRLHLFLGARYTHAAADVGRYEDPITKKQASFSDSWDNFSGSARFVYDLDEQEQYAIYGGVSQGFRAPNLSDLSRLDIARSGELEVASTDLEPEHYLNMEIGLKADTEKYSASVAYFHTRIDDLIVRRPTGETSGESLVVGKSNAGDGYVHGLEVAGRYNFNEHWSVFANGTWTQGEADQYPDSTGGAVREPLSRVVPLMGTVGLRWQSTDRHLWVEALCTAAAKADRLSSGDIADTQRIPPGGTPGWTVLTLRGGWNVNDNLTLTAGLDNILDEDYRAHGSGSNEPGFGGTVGVRVNF